MIASEPILSSPMMLLFQDKGVFIWGLTHNLGAVRRDLGSLAALGLLSNSPDALYNIGYRYNFGIDEDENLITLAKTPFARAIEGCQDPVAMVFHHSYTESAVVAWAETDRDLMSRARYFPAVLMKQFQLDHLPYFGSFGSGCTGFISMLTTAAGLLDAGNGNAIICITADIKPRGASYDTLREKILTSDCSSGFVLGRSRCGYQLLGINYYSTTRTLVALVEIVKRTVQMVRELSKGAGIELAAGNVFFHYPNIFPEAWKMVSSYLRIASAQHVLCDMQERAHCLSSDSVITLEKLHQCRQDRLHVVVNFGSGIHLGVCLLREEGRHASDC